MVEIGFWTYESRHNFVRITVKKIRTNELLAREYLESIGLVFIAENIVVSGGGSSMQSTVNIDDVLMLGEICIVEVKGRAKIGLERGGSPKTRRWSLAAQHVFWRLEDGDDHLTVTGVLVLAIENQLVKVNWHATDLDLG